MILSTCVLCLHYPKRDIQQLCVGILSIFSIFCVAFHAVPTMMGHLRLAGSLADPAAAGLHQSAGFLSCRIGWGVAVCEMWSSRRVAESSSRRVSHESSNPQVLVTQALVMLLRFLVTPCGTWSKSNVHNRAESVSSSQRQ